MIPLPVNLNMSVGILLITHEAIGQALILAARHVLPKPSLQMRSIEVSTHADLDALRTLAARYTRDLDQGHGVLVLSDLYGATPCNIGKSLGTLGIQLRCVSGLNLPMLLRVLNYAEKSLNELTEIAASGGHGGILIDHA